MVNRFRSLVAEVAFFLRLKPMSCSSIIRPVTLPKRESQKYLHSQRRPRLPNEGVAAEGGGARVQSGVGRLGRVLAVRCPPPNSPVRLVTQVENLCGFPEVQVCCHRRSGEPSIDGPSPLPVLPIRTERFGAPYHTNRTLAFALLALI